jgi:hypothetical protein
VDLSPQSGLIDEDAAALSVLLEEAGTVISVAGVDSVIRTDTVAHDPGGPDVERVAMSLFHWT